MRLPSRSKVNKNRRSALRQFKEFISEIISVSFFTFLAMAVAVIAIIYRFGEWLARAFLTSYQLELFLPAFRMLLFASFFIGITLVILGIMSEE